MVSASSVCTHVDKSLDGDGQVSRAARAVCPVNCPEKEGQRSQELSVSAGRSVDENLCWCRGDAPWRTRPAIPLYMGEEVVQGGLVSTEPFLKVLNMLCISNHLSDLFKLYGACCG